jgi:hypothetical protein
VFQRTFPFFVPLKRMIPAVHLAVFRATNGRLSSKLAGQKMLLLTTNGRRTGKPARYRSCTSMTATRWS